MKTYVSSLVICILLFAYPAFAEEITCSNDYGECTLDETGGSCECIGGDGIAMGGTEAITPTMEDCEAMLESCASSAPVDTCQSEKGMCTFYADGHSNCECADGSGTGGGSTDGDPGDPDYPDEDVPPTDGGTDDEGLRPEARGAECDALLLESCPNDAPDPAESCEADALEACNALKDFGEECFEMTIWPYQIIDCCDEYTADPDGMGEMLTCLTEAGCDNADDCFDSLGEDDALFGDGDSTGADGENRDDDLDSGDTQDEGSTDGDDTSTDGDVPDDEEDDSSNCQSTGFPAGLILMGLVAILAIRRRTA